MKYSKNTLIQRIIFTSIAGAMVLIAGLSGCSSSSSPAATNTVAISGKIITTNSPVGEAGVTVKGIYSDTDPANPSTTSAADGAYTLTVESGKAVSVQMSKPGLVTFNSQKVALTANITDGDEDIPTVLEAEAVIDLALGASTTPLANKAWFVVTITDAAGDELNGISISSIPAPDVEVYAACDGTDSLLNTTSGAPCNPERPVMYIAYFDAAPGDISVTAIGETQIAPVRMGEITVLDFEQ